MTWFSLYILYPSFNPSHVTDTRNKVSLKMLPRANREYRETTRVYHHWIRKVLLISSVMKASVILTGACFIKNRSYHIIHMNQSCGNSAEVTRDNKFYKKLSWENKFLIWICHEKDLFLARSRQNEHNKEIWIFLLNCYIFMSSFPATKTGLQLDYIYLTYYISACLIIC